MNPSRAMSAAMLGAFARATMRPSEMKTQSSSGGRGRVEVRIVFGDEPIETSKPARNPKRRARKAAKALKQSTMSTMAQRTLASRSRRSLSLGRGGRIRHTCIAGWIERRFSSARARASHQGFSRLLLQSVYALKQLYALFQCQGNPHLLQGDAFDAYFLAELGHVVAN